MSEKPMPSESQADRGSKESEATRLSRIVRMDVAEQLKNMAESLKSGDAGSAPGAHGDSAQHTNQATGDGAQHANQATGDGAQHATQATGDGSRHNQSDAPTQSQQSDQQQSNGSGQGDNQQQQTDDIGQTLLGDIANFARAQAEKALEQVMQETLGQIDQIRLDMFRPDQE